MRAVALLGLVALLAPGCATPDRAPLPDGAIEIRTGDVERFYALYAATGGRPGAEDLQSRYIAPGSEGLQHLTRVRNVDAASIARAIAVQPELYRGARACLAALPRIRERLRGAFDNLLAHYPEASRPPVTILIGRGRPFAIAGPGTGVQVALEAMCSGLAARYLNPDIEDRFVYTIAHEYVHVQQAPEKPDPTVLERALEEGVADFVGELVSGGIANVGIHAAARGRELEIERRFAADMDRRDLSAWFDNTTADDVGQLGYWVGYRIAKAYYRNAPDRMQAIRDMIRITDPHAFLAASGWRPGVALD